MNISESIKIIREKLKSLRASASIIGKNREVETCERILARTQSETMAAIRKAGEEGRDYFRAEAAKQIEEARARLQTARRMHSECLALLESSMSEARETAHQCLAIAFPGSKRQSSAPGSLTIDQMIREIECSITLIEESLEEK